MTVRSKTSPSGCNRKMSTPSNKRSSTRLRGEHGVDKSRRLRCWLQQRQSRQCLSEANGTASSGVIVVAAIVRGDGELKGVTGHLRFTGSSDINGIGNGVYTGSISH